MILREFIRNVSARDEELIRLAVPKGARDLLRLLSDKRNEKMWQTCLLALADFFLKEGYSERDLLILIGLGKGELSPELEQKRRDYNERYNRAGTQPITSWQSKRVDDLIACVGR